MVRAALALAVSGMLVGCSGMGSSSSDEANASAETPAVVAVAGEPVNSWCPIGHEEILNDEGGTAVHDGKVVAFCCSGCRDIWPMLSEEKKDEFVEMALLGTEQDFID